MTDTITSSDQVITSVDTVLPPVDPTWTGKRPQCAKVKADGDRCGGMSLPDSVYCFAHDPIVEQTRRESGSRQQGGRQRRHPDAGDHVEIATLNDLIVKLNSYLELLAEHDQTIDVIKTSTSVLNLLKGTLAEKETIEALKVPTGGIRIHYINDWRR